MSSESSDIISIVNRARTEILEKRFESALALLDTIAVSAPLQNLSFMRALCTASLGRILEARNWLAHEIENFPDNVAARELLQGLPALPDTPAAIEAFQEMTREFEQGKYREALIIADKIAGQNVPFGGLHFFRSLCFSALGLKDRALEAASAEIPNSYGHRGACVQIRESCTSLAQDAVKCLKEGNAAEALRIADFLASSGILLPRLHHFRSRCLEQLGRGAEALEARAQEERRFPPVQALSKTQRLD